MANYEPDDSALRVNRHREHSNGIHEHCLYENCLELRELTILNEQRLLAVAVFEELAELGIDPQDYWGEGLAEARELARLKLPEWLPDIPDTVTRLQARRAVKITIVTFH